MLFTVDSAKAFLIAKIRDQAAHDMVQFDEVEQRMFQFSEASGTPDMEASDKFDAAYDGKTYEAKGTKLVRKAYAHDKRNADRKKEWKQALKALSEEDFYGLVMVDNAGIPRGDASLWKFELQQLPFLLTELAVIGIGWFVVMQPHGFLLRLPDWFRLLLLPAFAWLVWYVGELYRQA
jgi:hypothetical protein